MKILITNDDGIDAPGLAILHDIARNFAHDNDIYTIAPASEQSGIGHAITYTKPLMFEERGNNHTAVYGTPADCVLVGIFEIMTASPPDLILSGVNHGNNSGQNTLYSGTLGAGIEAAMHNIPAISLSQFYGARLTKETLFDPARQHGPSIVEKLLNINIWHSNNKPLHYNVNFPPCPADEVKGHKYTTQGFRNGSPFTTKRKNDELWICSKSQYEKTEKGTDLHANLSDYISITPCSIDLTDQATLNRLRNDKL